MDAKYCSAWCGWCSKVVYGSYGWSHGRISGGVGGSSLVILDLRFVKALILDSNMMCLGIRSSRQLFRTCLVWLDIRMPLWQTIWCF